MTSYGLILKLGGIPHFAQFLAGKSSKIQQDGGSMKFDKFYQIIVDLWPSWRLIHAMDVLFVFSIYFSVGLYSQDTDIYEE